MKEGTTMPPLKHFIRYLESSIRTADRASRATSTNANLWCLLLSPLYSLFLGYKGNIRNANIKSRSSHLAYEVCFPRKTFRGFLSKSIYLAYPAILSMLHGESVFATLDQNQVVNVNVKWQLTNQSFSKTTNWHTYPVPSHWVKVPPF